MRTTVRLDEGLLREAKVAAARQGQTVTSLMERGLRLVLASSRRSMSRTLVTLPVSRATGGTRPGVGLDDSSSLQNLLDDRA